MLRHGEIRTISPDYFKGYITFPSFHAAAAAIFVWAGWHTRLRWFLLVLNVAMAFTAMSVGAHYMVDIIGGVALAGATIPFVGSWIRTSDLSTGRGELEIKDA